MSKPKSTQPVQGVPWLISEIPGRLRGIFLAAGASDVAGEKSRERVRRAQVAREFRLRKSWSRDFSTRPCSTQLLWNQAWM
jgi:hypothetical protein